MSLAAELATSFRNTYREIPRYGDDGQSWKGTKQRRVGGSSQLTRQGLP